MAERRADGCGKGRVFVKEADRIVDGIEQAQDVFRRLLEDYSVYHNKDNDSCVVIEVWRNCYTAGFDYDWIGRRIRRRCWNISIT